MQIGHVVAINQTRATQPQRRWSRNVAQERFKKTALAALARRLLVIAYRLLRDETVFRSVAKNAAREQHQDANHAHFAQSEDCDHRPETMTKAPRSSIRKALVDKEGRISRVALGGIGVVGGFRSPGSSTANELDSKGPLGALRLETPVVSEAVVEKSQKNLRPAYMDIA